jgi:hypothetical protein
MNWNDRIPGESETIFRVLYMEYQTRDSREKDFLRGHIFYK